MEQTTHTFGQIDLFCCNAGIALDGGIDAADEDWRRIWGVNVMSTFTPRVRHPGMLARGQGYFLQTASAAGLLTQIGSGAIRGHETCRGGFCRMALDPLWRCRNRGLLPLPARRALCKCCSNRIVVSAPFARGSTRAGSSGSGDRGGWRRSDSLIPHPDVAKYFRHKASDPIAGFGDCAPSRRKWGTRSRRCRGAQFAPVKSCHSIAYRRISSSTWLIYPARSWWSNFRTAIPTSHTYFAWVLVSLCYGDAPGRQPGTRR